MAVLIDANVVLRYLLDDHLELSAKAAKIIEEKDVLLPMEAACEVVYVLQKVYKVDREQIQQYLSTVGWGEERTPTTGAKAPASTV